MESVNWVLACMYAGLAKECFGRVFCERNETKGSWRWIGVWRNG